MKYLIFILELLAIAAWLKFGTKSIWSGLIGIVVIILISQLLHTIFKAR